MGKTCLPLRLIKLRVTICWVRPYQKYAGKLKNHQLSDGKIMSCVIQKLVMPCACAVKVSII
jgi:hypothetical protein